jgi:hypothetical protein
VGGKGVNVGESVEVGSGVLLVVIVGNGVCALVTEVRETTLVSRPGLSGFGVATQDDTSKNINKKMNGILFIGIQY